MLPGYPTRSEYDILTLLQRVMSKPIIRAWKAAMHTLSYLHNVHVGPAWRSLWWFLTSGKRHKRMWSHVLRLS
eukprot:COSAG02_NODE_6197_length_3735_cov_148.018427_5_plen_73_part_00